MEPLLLVHLMLMLLGFLLVAAGVTTVRYFRKKIWWFRLHKRFGILSTLFFGAGGIAAVSMIYLAGGPHFAVPHTWLGGVTLVLMAATLTAGFLQTKVSHKNRMRQIHRIAGRTAAGLSLLAVVTGAMIAGIIPGL